MSILEPFGPIGGLWEHSLTFWSTSTLNFLVKIPVKISCKYFVFCLRITQKVNILNLLSLLIILIDGNNFKSSLTLLIDNFSQIFGFSVLLLCCDCWNHGRNNFIYFNKRQYFLALNKVGTLQVYPRASFNPFGSILGLFWPFFWPFLGPVLKNSFWTSKVFNQGRTLKYG